jgi:hypothetical protein
MSFSTYFRQNWLGIVGLAVGIVGVVLSFYFYLQAVAEREPIFLVDPARTEIIKSERVTDTPLMVTRKTGELIKGDITAIRMYFWNRGKLGIRPANILQPLVVSIDGERSEILDFKVLRSSRSVVKPVIQRDESNPQQNLRLGFDILESGDGFSVQVIYVGNPNAKVSLMGTVEGVKSLTGCESLVRTKFWWQLLTRISAIVLGLALIVILGFLQRKLPSDSKKESGDRIDAFLTRFPRTAKALGICFVALLLGGFILLITFVITIPFQVVSNARRSAESSLIESVPSELIGGKSPR